MRPRLRQLFREPRSEDELNELGALMGSESQGRFEPVRNRLINEIARRRYRQGMSRAARRWRESR